jgi:polyhydroxyalkanoate synthesis regulator phasin
VDENLGAMLAALRERLSRGVVITGERLQETVDDAVTRGRMTRTDAEDLVAHLVSAGRKQTEDLLNDLETVLGRSRSELTTASKRVRTQARRAAGPGGDRVLREVDRARRAVGIGPAFPILGYDDLAAVQITERLDDLNSAQLRKVREYERRHGNRKSVLDAIERRLK